MNFKILAIGAVAISLLASCSSKKPALPYFQDINPDTFSVEIDPSQYEPKIEPSDELNITVSSRVPSLTIPYNLPMTNPALAQSGFVSYSTPSQATYIVSPDGTIDVPLIGKIHAAGMTCDQLAETILKKIDSEVEDPVVVVKLINFTVNVGGEVKTPGKYTVSGHRYSVIDALAAAGDLTQYGSRENVLLVREENGKRVAHYLDLTSADILTSPYFYLKQNDYIYVTPNNILEANSKYNTNNAYKLSVISAVVSGVSVIASLIIAFTVK